MELEEIWRDIKGYENYYQVSNLGNVRSLDRNVRDMTKDRIQHIKGKLLKATDNGKGYLIISLLNKGKRKNFYIHRLVAENFIANPFNYREVNHKDFNKKNNCIHNLEWVSQLENKRHFRKSDKAILLGQKLKEINKKKREKRIQEYSKIIIKKYIEEDKTIIDIAEELKIGNANVSKILKINNIPIKKRHRTDLLRDSNGRFIRKVL